MSYNVCDTPFFFNSALIRIAENDRQLTITSTKNFLRCPLSECCSFVLKEIVKGGKALALYFFDDYAVTADSRFCFYFNPSIHKDMEIQKRAGAAWNEMKKIFMEYKEKEN